MGSCGPGDQLDARDSWRSGLLNVLSTKKSAAFLSPENLRKILESRLFSNALWASVKGGEPLLHKELAQIIRTIKEKKVFVSLTTNADFSAGISSKTSMMPG